MMGALVRRVALLALVLLGPATAGGEDTWILDATSWERGKNLLPEPVLKRVQAGEYRFPVVPADPARFHDNYSNPFWAASAANEGKYDLDPASCGLRDKATGKVPDFYFGYPFPTITRDDPQAGWNVHAPAVVLDVPGRRVDRLPHAGQIRFAVRHSWKPGR